ncbi:KIF4 [Mytilus edulis]|uniref:KIF4 n=1 Tax=Mytilus edulis TaxID=6550 RepID=A0A8S3R9L1_MYTED|nr:KIF4 [Mytilus edulis]
MWERVLSEQEIMPNSEALKFHWLRSSWVFQFWAQASENFLQLSPLSDFGWKVSNNLLECIWDTEGNFQKVEQTVQWYTKGCSCKTGCSSNRCKCRKSKSDSKDGFCGPGCKCTNCVNLPDKSDTLLDISLSDEISDVEIDDDHDDDNDDVDDPAEAHLFSDLDMFYLASEDL